MLLGLLGSLHCAGMCGPLALAVPVVGAGRAAMGRSRLVYNAGRLVTYAALGLLFGGCGQALTLAGWQRGLSLLAGGLILGGWLIAARLPARLSLTRGVASLKAALGWMLRKRSMPALFGLGLLNGLLPCGLVYVAGAAAGATGTAAGGAVFMGAFGLGTLPVMLGVGLAGTTLPDWLRIRFQGWIPAGVAMVGGLLLLRGMALGIPVLSPSATGACPACVEPVAVSGAIPDVRDSK